MLGKETVCRIDGGASEVLFADGFELVSWGHRLGNGAGGVAGADDVSGEKSDQAAFWVYDGEGSEGELFGFNEFKDFPDGLLRMNANRILDETVHIIFDPADLGELLLLGHVAVNQSHPSTAGHRDGHVRFGDSVHVGGHDGEREMKRRGQCGGGVRVFREHVCEECCEGDVVVGECGGGSFEEGVGRFVESVVYRVRCEVCHDG